MTVIFNEAKTLKAENAFRFVCPILGVEASISDCFRLEEQHMVGKRVEGRNACHACMASGKCPIWHIQQEILRGKDEYHGDRLGKLDDRLLARIKPVMVQQQHIDKYGVDGATALVLLASSKTLATTANGEALAVVPARPEPGQGRAPAKSPKSAEPDETMKAALSGDMSAAVNAMMKAPAIERDPGTWPDSASPRASTPAPAPEGRPMTLLERARLAREGKAA